MWAAGNVVNPFAQVIIAAAGGYTAAGAINGYLVDEDVDRAVAASARAGNISLVR